MNDLTKEEIESILDWGNVYVEFGHSFTYKLHKPLIDKISSMIENYCEHEWEGYTIRNIRCKKCLKDIWYD